MHPGGDPSRGRRRGERGAPSMHDDARSGEAALIGRDLFHAGLLPRSTTNARRIFVPDPPKEQQRLLKLPASGSVDIVRCRDVALLRLLMEAPALFLECRMSKQSKKITAQNNA